MFVTYLRKHPYLYNAARTVAEKIPVARKLYEVWRGRRSFNKDAEIASALGFVKEGLAPEQAASANETLKLAAECGQFETVGNVESRIGLKGSRVLEVGCGHCWYAPFFLGRGAAAYVGIDPFRNFDDNRIYDYRRFTSGEWRDAYVPAPLSLRAFLSLFENITVMNEDILSLNMPASSFERIFLLTVSEHFRDPKAAFRKIYDLLAPGGKVFIAHHNYYSWAGHHQSPKFVSEYDPHDVKMAALADWNHLVSPPSDDGGMDYLNRIRIDELTGILRDLFRVESCVFEESTERTGRKRLTPEIRKRFPQYSKQELLTEMVFLVCSKQGE